MGATEKPGEIIRIFQADIKRAVLDTVQTFEQRTDVTVQSIHYYVGEPNAKLLDDRGKQKVDIILKL